MAISIRIILLLFFCNSFSVFAKAESSFLLQDVDSLNINSSDKASQLLFQKKYDSLLLFCSTELSKLLDAPQKDSLEIAQLYKYQNKAHYQLGDYLEAIKNAELALDYCTNSEEGRLLKGQLYSDKASSENYAGKSRSNFNSTLNAIKYLTSVRNLDYDYLITSYRYVAEQCAYHGNIDDANMYMRLAEDLYYENKDIVDKMVTDPNGYRYKYEIILAYSKIYQLYQYGKSASDSLALIETFRRIETYSQATDFDIKRDGIYYTTALSHVGDWYASRKPEKETTEEDLLAASVYINKAIDLIENKGYEGILMSLKYNRVKVLALSNKLDDAEREMRILLNSVSESDGRRPYFLAQKGLIKSKQNQKDSALVTFYEALKKVHSDSVPLEIDLSNFKSSTNFGHTNLILRIAEEMDRYFPNDSLAKKTVASLYPLAFKQFENSYDKRKFNRKQKTYLRKILRGLLDYSGQGYLKDEDPIDILNRFENIQNLLAWQKFNQNRQISNFPRLDSLQVRNYELRGLIAENKFQNNTSISDSLQTLLSQTEKYTKETFPNLSLFNTANINIDRLRNELDENTLVIKYVVFESQLAIYSISKADFKVELKPWTSANTKAINDFVNQIKSQSFNNQKSSTLAQLLLPEIDSSIQHIIVNPDNELSQLPFELLLWNNQFLVETFGLSYTSNLGFVFPQVNKGEYDQEMAIYAPEYPNSNEKFVVRSHPVYLEGAKQESKLISELFASNLYDGKELTKQDFIKTASRHKLLHLAMHAVVDNSQSGISRLLFSDENSGSDDLYLEELYGLALNADLAVLSACNTGVDKSKSGSDIESFQRAFTFAGVPATVASLWEVPDQPTKEIMVSFYKNLKTGASKSEALRQAKLEFLERRQGTKLAQPYYWAGFVLYGDDSPIVNGHLILVCVLGFSLMSILFIFIYKRIKK